MDFRTYLRLLVILSSLEVLMIALLDSSADLCFHCDDQQLREKGYSTLLLQHEFTSPAQSSQKSATEPSTHSADKMQTVALPQVTWARKRETSSRMQGISSIRTGTKRGVSRLSPPDLAAAEGLQIDDQNMILVGGYINNYRNVSRWIQFFNITSQVWKTKDRLELPETLAETHQGIAFDKETNLLYVVSGQKGSGCMPATTAAGRVHVETGRFDALPSLPRPRYAPGVEIVADPHNPKIKHLHVFGGACHTRNQTATDHWRLVIPDTLDLANLTWEVLEPVPDAGTHGTSFVYNGYIYYTGFCTLDPGTVASPSMAECHLHAAEHSRQLLHHVSDAGLAYRYPTAFASSIDGQTIGLGWERLKDMPFPVCHGGAVSTHDKLFVVGGVSSSNYKFLPYLRSNHDFYIMLPGSCNPSNQERISPDQLSHCSNI
jgi:hypothetical protein